MSSKDVNLAGGADKYEIIPGNGPPITRRRDLPTQDAWWHFNRDNGREELGISVISNLEVVQSEPPLTGR